jgi:NAD(P) transhydrogenase subunit beta
MKQTIVELLYLSSAIIFIVGLKRLSDVRKSHSGNMLAALAMLFAAVGTLLSMDTFDPLWIVAGLAAGSAIGAFAALRVPMTSMPEMVALLNGSGGAASALVALSVFWRKVVEADGATSAVDALGATSSVTVMLSVLVGGLTLTGSLIAYGKLQGSLKNGQPILLPARHFINGLLGVLVIGAGVYGALLAPTAELATVLVLAVVAVSLVLGVTLVIPIGGADMPVVVSLLNSYSGIAAAAAGFVVGNYLLIIGGAMVGAAGLILTQIMCVSMNRSLMNVLVGGFGEEESSDEDAEDYENIRSSGPAESAMMLDIADSVCIIPGYGLAVAQAQHTVRELADALIARGVKVTYGIHPVAGRMPGHMNVLLAEADVPYDQLLELESANSELKNTDVAIVVGANDVVNPSATDDPDSPIYGMPILNAHHAGTVFVIKRSLSAGYAGIKNPLFDRDKTMMVFGDAKDVLQKMVNEYEEL